MAYLTKHNYTIYYEVIGQGQPLVYLHGLGGSLEAIKNTYEHIDNVKLILIDLQGHGKSTMDVANFDFKTLAADVIDVVDSLQIGTFMLAGISMGAAVSLRLAIDNPNRLSKLVLIRNAWINKPMEKRFVEIYELCAHYLSINNLPDFIETKQFKALEKASKNSANSFKFYFTDEASLKYYCKFSIIPKLKPFKNWQEISQLNIETLIINNDNDPIHTSVYGKKIAQHLKNVSYREIPSKDVNAIAHTKQLNYYLSNFITSR